MRMKHGLVLSTTYLVPGLIRCSEEKTTIHELRRGFYSRSDDLTWNFNKTLFELPGPRNSVNMLSSYLL